jgi:D-arabinose 1-dehydrogenase-like Zn-dependent alcohol dehydrogenase
MPSFTVFKGSEEGKIVKSQTTRPDLKGDDVLVKITASGVCGTDVHYLHSDIVLGHEGAGVVEEVGPDSSLLKKGDRVGWGYLHNCCGHCEKCLGGLEQYCAERKWFGEYNLDQGSFGSHAVWKESYLFKIPDGITDVNAAPLMCGGATVFEALRSYNIKPVHRVAVMGVGGLGHLAIQFAAKMGCDVLVLSGTDSKKEEALSLGAKAFVATKGKKELDVGRKIDVLIVTTSFSPGTPTPSASIQATKKLILVNRLVCPSSIHCIERYHFSINCLVRRLYHPAITGCTKRDYHPGLHHPRSGCSPRNARVCCPSRHQAHEYGIPNDRGGHYRSNEYAD